MFHHAHCYIGSKIFDLDSELFLIGCLLPDIAITKIIGWEDGLHGYENSAKFDLFIKDHFPKQTDLSIGVYAHNILDFFSHTKYLIDTGYAFQNNQQLTQLVKESYDIDNQSAQGKAHNYIESAVDIYLLNKFSDVNEKVKAVLKNSNRQLVADILSKYFDISKDECLEAVNEYFDLFSRYDFSKVESWNNFWEILEQKLSLSNIGRDERISILNLAVATTADSVNDFINNSISLGKEEKTRTGLNT